MFVLILVFVGGLYNTTPSAVRVGNYHSKAQCETAGKMVKGVAFWCVPVPVTGN